MTSIVLRCAALSLLISSGLAAGTKADPPYRRMGKALGAGRDVVI